MRYFQLAKGSTYSGSDYLKLDHDYKKYFKSNVVIIG